MGERFADLLRRARRAVGLTQRQLADRTGVAERTISDLERGIARAPRHATIELLSEGLCLDPRGRERLFAAARASDVVIGRPPRVPKGGAAAPSFGLPRPQAESGSALLGRDHDLNRLGAVLADGGVVTLTGPGGVGKSRLALAAAERYACRRGGAHAVALGGLRDPAAVMPTIAASLGVAGRPDLAVAIAAWLRERGRALLVLDDAERVSSAGPAIARLAAAAPEAAILVTTRTPLDVHGERVVTIAPLPVPTRDPVGGWPSRSSLQRNPAVGLFLGRARAAGMDERAGTLVEVAEIVARLDGLPLAIELVAAHAGLLSPSATLALLERAGLTLLERHSTVPHRPRTMQAAVAWSIDRLSVSARQLLAVLGVFVGGFTPEALTAVLDGIGEERLAVGLPELVRAGLVHQVAGGVRFSMLEPIRWVAAERLAGAWNARSVHRAHAAWFARWARRTGDAAITSALATAMASEADDRANATAALRWSIAAGELDDGAAIVAGQFRLWEAAAILAPLRGALTALADRAAALSDPADRRIVLYAAAYLDVQFGNAAGVLRRTSRLRALAADDPAALGLALLAESLLPAEDPAALVPSLRESATLLAAARHPWAWMPRFRIGAELSLAGRLDEGLELLEAVLADRERAGDRFDEPPVLWQIGRTLTDMGRFADARSCYRRMLRLCRQHGFAAAMVQALHGYADAASRGDDPALLRVGAILSGAVEAFHERIGLSWGVVWSARTEEARANVAAHLGPGERDRLLADGRLLGFADAVALAVGDAEGGHDEVDGRGRWR